MANKGTGRDENRVPLYQVIPLAVPFTISIGISDFCNFKCIYCSHSIEQGVTPHEKILTWNEFEEMIGQIELLYKENGGVRAKNFAICGVGEPMTHKQLPEMVRYCKEHNISDRIELTTNGSLLTHELSDQLIDAGLTRLLISIQGVNEKKYNKICGYDIDFERFIHEIRYFYNHRKQCAVYIKTLDIALDDEAEEEEFYKIFSPIADMVNIEKTLKGFDGVDYNDMVDAKRQVTRYGYEYVARKCCDSLFMRMNISTQGDVNACACQWPPLILGNIHKLPLYKIWNGEVHRRYMRLHLEGKKDTIPRCKTCESMSDAGHPMDNLDDHMNDLLKKMYGEEK